MGIGQWKVKTKRLGTGSMHGAGCWYNLTNGVDDGGLWPSKPRRHGVGGRALAAPRMPPTPPTPQKNDAALCGPCFCGASPIGRMVHRLYLLDPRDSCTPREAINPTACRQLRMRPTRRNMLPQHPQPTLLLALQALQRLAAATATAAAAVVVVV